ncbi:hypothetical protein [Streptomyces wuyuanensis]|uniref:hypothetical protein n=1 Tax=Streptomyces wuyuanensis TaxID=1196353 RepID=UPI003425DCF0
MKATVQLITAGLHRSRLTATIVLVALCAGIAAAQLVTVLSPKTYEARASLLVTDGSSGSPVGTLAQSLTPTIARMAESRRIALGTADQTGLRVRQVVGHITADSQPSLQIVTLTADAHNPVDAAALANGAAHHLATTASAWLSTQKSVPHLRVLDTALPPELATSPKPLLNQAIGGLLGLLAGVGFASMHRRSDDRLREPAQIENALKLPVLAALTGIPRRLSRRGARRASGYAPVAGGIREAASALTVLTHPLDRKRILVTGIRDDDTTMAAALLALDLAGQNHRVTLVDAQQSAASTLGRLFPTADPTLAQVLTEPDLLLRSLQDKRTGVPTVLAAGSTAADDQGRTRSGQYADLLTAAASHSDMLLVNGPALLGGGGDSAPLSKHVDAAVLVVRAGTLSLAQARRAVLLLQTLRIPIAGVLLMGASRIHRHALGWPDTPVAWPSNTPAVRLPASRPRPDEDSNAAVPPAAPPGG